MAFVLFQKFVSSFFDTTDISIPPDVLDVSVHPTISEINKQDKQENEDKYQIVNTIGDNVVNTSTKPFNSITQTEDSELPRNDDHSLPTNSMDVIEEEPCEIVK